MMVLDTCPLASLRLMPCSLEYTIKVQKINIIGLLTVYTIPSLSWSFSHSLTRYQAYTILLKATHAKSHHDQTD